jgi:hypothetical protein
MHYAGILNNVVANVSVIRACLLLGSYSAAGDSCSVVKSNGLVRSASTK